MSVPNRLKGSFGILKLIQSICAVLETDEASASVKDASKSDLNGLRLAAIDIYSGQDDKRWTLFPGLPLQIDAVSIQASIAHDSTGKDLVSSLGEPQRKGGGAGGRSGPAAWMEWTLQLCSTNSSQPKDIKIQIELAGAAARGADRWNAERAGSCPWAVITIT